MISGWTDGRFGSMSSEVLTLWNSERDGAAPGLPLPVRFIYLFLFIFTFSSQYHQSRCVAPFTPDSASCAVQLPSLVRLTLQQPAWSHTGWSEARYPPSYPASHPPILLSLGMMACFALCYTFFLTRIAHQDRKLP